MSAQIDSTLKYTMFMSALAVLKCPMTVDDKINTLTAAIEAEVKNLEYMPLMPSTGLKPFDDATAKATTEWLEY